MIPAGQQPSIANAINDVIAETYRAAEKFPNYNTAHEGASVIREEFEELWDEVKADTGYTQEAYTEACQLAATAVRYMVMVKGRQLAGTDRAKGTV